VPHGGFITSCFLRVARTHFQSTLSHVNQPNTITLHLDFLRRTEVGAATFKVADTKLGRQTSVIHITLTQSNPPRTEVVGYLTQTNLSLETGISLPTDYALHPPAPPVNFSLLPADKDENWVLERELPHAYFRKATTKAEFYLPRKGQALKSQADEWVRFRSGELFTDDSLGYISDMWPQLVEAYNTEDLPSTPSSQSRGSSTGQEMQASPTKKFWYPTVLLNLDIKKSLPQEGVEWLFARVSAKKIKNGRMDIEVIILDEQEDIVALSHHVCLIVGAERNTSQRSKM
jgi:hypothetical protein